MASLLNSMALPHFNREKLSSRGDRVPLPLPFCSYPKTQPTETPPAFSNGSVCGIGRASKPIVVYGNPPTYVSAPGRRIIAVGDVHGDIDQTRYALVMAGVLSSNGEDLWTGGDSVLVQLGDILDGGEDEIAILSLLRSLDIQATANGGAVFQLNGNHETMNVAGHFSFVHSGAMDECFIFQEYLNDCEHDDWDKAFVNWCGKSRRRKDEWKRRMPTNYRERKLGGFKARGVLFRPGGPLVCELARHPVALKVNDLIFCHGGLLPHHVAYGIERMNMDVSQWMRGLIKGSDLIAIKCEDSVVWNRCYSADSPYMERRVSDVLQETLHAVGAKAMVVSHTPQPLGANRGYNGSVWPIDVGMSSGILNSRPEVLEIRDDEARMIRDDDRARSNEEQKEQILFQGAMIRLGR